MIWIIAGTGAILTLGGFALATAKKQAGQSLKVAGLVILAGAGIWHSVRSWQPENEVVVDRGQAALAYFMAQSLPGELQRKEGPVLLVMPPDRVANSSSLDGFYESFARVLLRFPALEVREATLGVSASELESGSFKPEALRKTLGEFSDPAAIVFWTGYPSNPEAQAVVAEYASKECLIYTCDFQRTGAWTGALADGVVSRAFIPKEGSDNAELPDGSPPNVIFQQLYTVQSAGAAKP